MDQITGQTGASFLTLASVSVFRGQCWGGGVGWGVHCPALAAAEALAEPGKSQ